MWRVWQSIKQDEHKSGSRKGRLESLKVIKLESHQVVRSWGEGRMGKLEHREDVKPEPEAGQGSRHVL